MNERYQEDVEDWFQEARQDGPLRAPKSLINALGKSKNELLYLMNSGVFDACSQFHKEFPGITKARYYSLEPDEKEKVVALLRWFKQPIAITAKEHCHEAIGAVYLLVGACFGREILFWDKSGISADRDDDLAQFAAKILRGMSFAFSIPQNTPIYEHELLEQWEKAHQEYDFVTIGRLLRSFENVLRPSAVMEQAVLCLQSNAPQKLLRIANNCNNPMTTWTLVELLSPLMRLKLAEKTKSIWFLFFSLLYGGCGWKRRREVSNEIHLQLVKTLLKASKNITFWKQLLAVINEYVYRYPDMQKSLGTALAKASNPALIAYVESLQIRTDAVDSQLPDEADGLEACFYYFATHASRNKCKLFFCILYSQWEIFIDSSNLLAEESHTSILFRTNLDCAASYYLKAFSTKKNIYSLIKHSVDRLNSFRNIWQNGSVESGKFLNIELCKINVFYSAIIENESIFERPFPFRTPASLLESDYMLLTFPHQLRQLKNLAKGNKKTGRV